ncbi:MAG: lipid-transfer protein [Chloroflexi bacterium]|nr:lipid-transfer protein [Chloroflexota bacterium]
MSLKNKSAVIGIGHTAYSKGLGRSELSLALEASKKAIDDAGLKNTDIDGIVRWDIDNVQDDALAAALGIRELKFFATAPWGGGAGGNAVQLAAMAVATGQANNVIVFRSRNRGKQSTQAGGGQHSGGRPWEKQSMLVAGSKQFTVPFGLASPVQEVAVLTRRHMHVFGTKAEHLGGIAINQRTNAVRNPDAVMRTPITMDDYLTSRWVAEPMRLFDCCLETDGAGAVIVTAAANARNGRNKPVYILAAAQGISHGSQGMTNYYRDDFFNTDSSVCAKTLYQRAGVQAKDIDVAQLYDAFSTTVLLLIEDFLCGRGNAGALIESGGITFAKGKTPVNTSGAGLSEVYLHGFNLIIEAVRQVRGTAVNQVKDVELSLYAAAPPVPTSAFILSKNP